MPLMPARPNDLGDLLRARRRLRKVGFKQLYAATGLEPETLRKWEVGEIAEPPLRGVLIYARQVGISLEELEAAALPNGAPVAAPDAAGIADSGEAIGARADAKAKRGQQRRGRRAP